MSGTSCELWPKADNGKESNLYKDILKKAKVPRPLTNLIYASYKATPDIAKQMDRLGYKKDNNGEHRYSDLAKFIDMPTIRSNMLKKNDIAKSVGFIDSTGQPVDFSSSEDALQKADDFNNKYKGLVATVVKHDNVFNVVVRNRDADTFQQAVTVRTMLNTWNVYKQVFKAAGIDITNVPDELKGTVTAYNSGLVNQIKSLQMSQLQYLNKNDTMLLLFLNQNQLYVKRFINNIGSLEDAAQFIYDVNNGSIVPTAAQARLAQNAFTQAQQFNGIDVDALSKQVSTMDNAIRNSSPEAPIAIELHELNKKYHIGINEINKVKDTIESLADAVQEAIFVLDRRLKEIQRTQGTTTAEAVRLQTLMQQLLKDIAGKRYSISILQFLQEGSIQVSQIDNILKGILTTGTPLENAFSAAQALWKAHKIILQYQDIADALANPDFTMDDNMGKQTITDIRKAASQLSDYMRKKQDVLKDKVRSTMYDLMVQIVGPETAQGQDMASFLDMAWKDSGYFDRFLYSMGRASNPVIGAMGKIVLDAKDERLNVMREYDERIRAATQKLLKTEKNSEFMYEADGVHIISDIDWDVFNKAKSYKYWELRKQGYKGVDLAVELDAWGQANTEDRVVDKTTGRTERIPNMYYRKAFPRLTPAQQEYYDTMMQIKGEIGSMLPLYAQKQYLAPQVRKSFFDATGNAKSVKDIVKAMQKKAEDLVTIREDDDLYGMNGIINGEDVKFVDSDFDGTPLKQIPIFFVNRLKDSEDLLKNFSTGLQALAGTAINYYEMSQVLDVVEFMGDFVKGKKSRGETSASEMVENGVVRMVKELRNKVANGKSASMVDGFINQHFFGQYRIVDGKLSGALVNKLASDLVSYTSFKSLSTNAKGAFANYVQGELQMLIEAGGGEFYGIKNLIKAHTRLFGKAGVTGEIWDILNETEDSKGRLLDLIFDPEQDSFNRLSHKRYHNSAIRKMLSVDLSFMGYGSGEYLIHKVNEYAVLDAEKVIVDGKRASLYDAFEVYKTPEGTYKLRIKAGATREDGSAITDEYIDSIRRKIKYVNQSTHGAMNLEDRGLIYQHWLGAMAMNFRQWMVEYYSRRYRKAYWDASLGEFREGYWRSVAHFFASLPSDEHRDAWKEGHRLMAVLQFAKDLAIFNLQIKSHWSEMSDMQRSNCRRAMTELIMWISLCGLSFALGESDEHKKEFWRRWWIYQTKRAIMDTEAGMPNFNMFNQFLNIMQSPFGSVQTISSFLYIFTGLGDINDTLQSGPYEGWNKYLANVFRSTLPFVKDIQQMKDFDTREDVFNVFNQSPTGRY